MKCHIESNHDVPRYPCKYWEAPLNAEARLKCEKCEHTLVFKTLTLKHTNAIHDDIRNTCEVVVIKLQWEPTCDYMDNKNMAHRSST